MIGDQKFPTQGALRLHPSLSDLYQIKIRQPSSAMQDPSLKMEATESLHGQISGIRQVPYGALAGSLALSLGVEGKPGQQKILRTAACARALPS